MKRVVVGFFLLIFSFPSYGIEKNKSLNMVCKDYSWSDVETLVMPYLDDELYTALVMQGQSSNYESSAAASQAMDDSLPDVIKRILQALIVANC